MVRQIALVAALAAVGISSAAFAGQPAAKLNASGAVLVSQNGKFAPVKADTVLRAGDRVVATSGSAKLTYADGCAVSVTARSMATVGESSPCATGGSSVVRVANQGYDNGGSDDDSNADLYLWGAFGVLTLVVVGAAVADDEEPVSP